MPAAAFLGSTQFCPMLHPNGNPHMGGALHSQAAQSVWVGGRPALILGSLGQCVGAPVQIVSGSTSVFIEGKAAVRVGDTTNHGGKVVSGCIHVLIGG